MKRNYLKYIVLPIVLISMEIFTQAQIIDLNSFSGTANPNGELVLCGNKLYGMSYEGGTFNDGTIYFIDTNGSNYNVLFNFNGTNGKNPQKGLTFYQGKLYGMTFEGGTGYGNIFSIDTNGNNFTNLFNFNQTDGGDPIGNLTPCGKKLFGMALGGGSNEGVLFSIDTDGTNFNDIITFNGPNGELPYGSLILSGSKLFGMTSEGGVGIFYGVLFSMDTTGNNYKVLYNFNGVDGERPSADLTISGNKLYGTAFQGGASDSGVLFSIDTNGNNYKVMINCNDTNGFFPEGDLVLSGNKLYGMTPSGIGTNGKGNIFSIDTNGNNFTQLFYFNGANGEYPDGTLLQSGNYYYGTTYNGGLDNDGVVFEFHFIGISANVSANAGCYGGNNGSASVNPSGGTSPYTYLWMPGGLTNSTASGLTAGTYTVTITDNSGSTASVSVIITQPTGMTITTDSVNVTSGCNGKASVTVMSGGKAPYTYSWSPAGGTSDTINGKCAGDYCCTITDNNGCSQTACVKILYYVGIDNVSPGSEQVTIYPNPSSGIFTIQSSVISSQSLIEIYNVLGEKVYSQFNIQQSTFNINLSSQPDGVYLYRAINGDGVLLGQGKLIISR